MSAERYASTALFEKGNAIDAIDDYTAAAMPVAILSLKKDLVGRHCDQGMCLSRGKWTHILDVFVPELIGQFFGQKTIASIAHVDAANIDVLIDEASAIGIVCLCTQAQGRQAMVVFDRRVDTRIQEELQNSTPRQSTDVNVRNRHTAFMGDWQKRLVVCKGVSPLASVTSTLHWKRSASMSSRAKVTASN